ncbi:uncharacterized protein LOC143259535 [Megalopta genalis]|uniref:uncharacterized protein LOC143259535 n=1 Tax=Megalopta genalis TaxID=115081 RepID=UPI003FD58879
MAAENTQHLQILCKRRAVIKSQLTEFEEILRGFCDSPDIVGLTCRLRRLKEVYAPFNDIQAELAVLQEEIEQEEEWRTMEERYMKADITAHKLLSAFQTGTEASEFLGNAYGDERFIVIQHAHSIVKMSPMTDETAVNLRKFVMNVKHHLTCLEQYNVPLESCDVILMAILLPKLTKRTKAAFINTLKDEEALKTQQLLKFLVQRANNIVIQEPHVSFA